MNRIVPFIFPILLYNPPPGKLQTEVRRGRANPICSLFMKVSSAQTSAQSPPPSQPSYFHPGENQYLGANVSCLAKSHWGGICTPAVDFPKQTCLYSSTSNFLLGSPDKIPELKLWWCLFRPSKKEETARWPVTLFWQEQRHQSHPNSLLMSFILSLNS